MADQRPPQVERKYPEPVPRRLEDATLEQVARAIFAGAKKPDPSRRRE